MGHAGSSRLFAYCLLSRLGSPITIAGFVADAREHISPTVKQFWTTTLNTIIQGLFPLVPSKY